MRPRICLLSDLEAPVDRELPVDKIEETRVNKQERALYYIYGGPETVPIR